MSVSFTITGNAMYMGSFNSEPNNDVPVEGNIYYNTEDEKVYIFISNGISNTWQELGGGDTGEQGIQGIQGIQGETGSEGPTGPQGPADGDSAYTVASNLGFVGDVDAWLESLIGADGAGGTMGPIGQIGQQGPEGPIGQTGPQGIEGPQGSNGGVPGPQGPMGFVSGYDDLIARIEALETFSPLDNVANGTVSGITYVNKQEILYTTESLLNPTLETTGTLESWTPGSLTDIFFWMDAADTSSILTDDATNRASRWNDKSGNGNNFSSGGGQSYNVGIVDTQPNTNTRTHNGLNVIDMVRDDDHSLRTDFDWGTREKFTMTMMYQLDTNTEFTPHLYAFASSNARGEMSIFNYENARLSAVTNTNFPFPSTPDVPHIYTLEWDWTTDGYVKHYLDGVLIATQAKSAFNVNVVNRLILFNYRQMSVTDSTLPSGFRNQCADGFIGEVICSNAVGDDERERTTGYLSHKWNIQLSDNHIYRFNAPTIGGIIINDWSKQSGHFDIDLLSTSNQIKSANTGGVSIRQNISVSLGDVYDVFTTRDDSETSLATKIRTSTPVKWLSHLDDINDEADILDDQEARFQVLNTTDFYIEVDTVNELNIISQVNMKKVVIADGSIEELTNNTIRKISGGDGWNAGASSAEYIDGQGEGYIQFQIAQSGKSIKVGLTYQDIDYNVIIPYQMLFTGTHVLIENSQYPYGTGDWFRIRHDSVNNQILYQKRDSNLDYITFYTHTHSVTTDGRNLYLDTSFYHEDGRINDVSMIN